MWNPFIRKAPMDVLQNQAGKDARVIERLEKTQQEAKAVVSRLSELEKEVPLTRRVRSELVSAVNEVADTEDKIEEVKHFGGPTGAVRKANQEIREEAGTN